MKTMEDHLLKYALKKMVVLDRPTATLIRDIDILSYIITENLYVLDVLNERFYYVNSEDIFLCGYSIDDARKEGYDFYSKIVYSEDLPLWTLMRNIVLQYLNNTKEKRKEIICFSCTFRLQRLYPFLPQRPLQQMICHHIKPIWNDNELRYLICSVRSSTSKEPGNLRMYNKGRLTYDEYNFRTKRWEQKTKIPLTKRESAILMLALQGKNTKEIADQLCRGQNTIRNQIKSLFSKLHVHSMQEAIEVANNHSMVYLE